MIFNFITTTNIFQQSATDKQQNCHEYHFYLTVHVLVVFASSFSLFSLFRSSDLRQKTWSRVSDEAYCWQNISIDCIAKYESMKTRPMFLISVFFVVWLQRYPVRKTLPPQTTTTKDVNNARTYGRFCVCVCERNEHFIAPNCSLLHVLFACVFGFSVNTEVDTNRTDQVDLCLFVFLMKVGTHARNGANLENSTSWTTTTTTTTTIKASSLNKPTAV